MAQVGTGSVTEAARWSDQPMLGCGCSQQAIERGAFERVAELKIDIEHGVALVAAELLDAGGGAGHR
jgi:hypothetical protein